MFRSSDFFEDFISGLGPDEWLGVGIVLFEVLHDGVFQLGDALEGAASNAEKRSTMLSQDDGCEVQMEARMRLEPAFDGGRLMRGIVVDDEMQSETRRWSSDRSV